MADAADIVIKATDRATAPARNVANAFRGVADAARGAGLRLMGIERGGLSSLIGGVALGGVAHSALMGIANAAKSAAFAVLELGAAFAKGIVAAAAFMDQSLFAFKTLLKGTGAAKGELRRVIALAAELGLPVEDSIKQFQKLLAMQFKPDQAAEMLKLAADLRAVGADAEGVQRALTAITQIKAKGRLQSEELVGQLAEAGVSTELVMAALSKQLGKTSGDVRKLLEAGKITADQGIEAIKAAVLTKVGSKKLGQAGAEAAMSTLTGMGDVFRARVTGIVFDMGERIGPTLKAVLGPIGKDILAFLDSPDAKAGINTIVSGIKSLLGGIQAGWPMVKEFLGGFAEGLGRLKDMARGFSDMLGPALKAMGIDAKDAGSAARLLGHALALAVGGLVMFTALVGGVVAVFVAIPVAIFKAGAAVGAFQQAVGAFVANAVAWLMTLPGRIAAVGAELWNSAVQLGSSIIDGLVNGIQTGVGKVTTAMKGVGSAALSAFGVSIDAHSPSKAFETRGLWGAEGAARGFERGSTMVESASSKMGAAALGASWGGLGGNTTNRNAVSLTIQVQAPPAGSSAEDFAAQIGPAIRREVIGIFEDLAVQVGA
ncbi:MAG: hypothetical protein AMXMBFR56_76880 [Polyangiaceae bacterium]